MTTKTIWKTVVESLLAKGIKAGDFNSENWFREQFGIPNTGQLFTKEENDQRNLFFTVQFDHLKKHFLKEHKLLLDRDSLNGVSGFLAIHPKDHAKRTSKKAVLKIKREMARASFSIKNVDVANIAAEDRKQSLDASERFNRFVTMVRSDARDFKKIGRTLVAEKSIPVPLLATTTVNN